MPGRIHAGDLPAELRRKLVGRGERRRAPARPRPTADNDAGKPRWRCHHCAAVFTAWAAAQRHQNQPGHRWIETWIGEEDW